MPATELTLVTGERVVVQGSAEATEAAVLAAARGSIMQLVWLTEVQGTRRIGVNPEHVVALRETPAAP